MSEFVWQHTGKQPRYFALPTKPQKPIPEHEPDATYNPQGEWACHRCGELLRMVDARVPA